MSVVGGVQPSKIKRLVQEAVGETDEDDGFIQRFSLIAFPDPQGWKLVDRAPDWMHGFTRSLS